MNIDSAPAAAPTRPEIRSEGPGRQESGPARAGDLADKAVSLVRSLVDHSDFSEALSRLQELDQGDILSGDSWTSLLGGLSSWAQEVPSGTDPRDRAPSLDPEPPTLPGAKSEPGALGLRAKEYGRDGKAINPNTGDNNWYFYCLGWTNQALKSEGTTIPELQAPDAKTAYRQALEHNKIQYGDPPPGAIVFYPELSEYGHVGIVNEDGTSYRGTVPPSESKTTLGDRPIPDRGRVAWMYPE